MPILPLLFALLCALVPAAALAQGSPTTVQDPAIALNDLESMLTPLTKAELQTEADAWLRLVQDRCTAIARAEIESRSTADAARRDELLAQLSSLRDERTARIDRFNRVVAELMEKGGDEEKVAEYRAYVSAVSGLRVDVTDTSAAWATVVGWLRSAEGGLRVGRNILFFLLTLLAFRVLSRIAGRLTVGALRGFRGTSDLLRDFFANSVRRVVFFIGIVVALSMLEVEVGPFLAAIGAAGFVIGFALQGTLSNFASGVMILLYRPYDIGHFIDAAGVQGTVEQMSLVSTQVRTGDNKSVVIPNSSIWGGIITNYHGKDTRRVDLKFGVSYGDDLGKAEAILRAVVSEHPLVLKEPEPVIRVHELADSSVNFIVRPWTRTTDYWAVYWDLTRTVKERFDAAGVSIPFPQRDVHLHQVAAT